MYIELDMDLDLNNIQFEMIGNYSSRCFMGSFNGNNHKIYNLNLNMSREYNALFFVNGGTIENLIIENCELTSPGPANAVIAILGQNSTIRNCVNKANLTVSNYIACGIAECESSNNTIDNCTNYGVITTTEYAVPYGAYQISNGDYTNCKELGKAIGPN